MSRTPAVPVAKFTAGVIDTSGAPSLGTAVSPQIFAKIQNDPNLFSGAWRKMILEKNLKQIS
jgi:hypothetical protein